MVFHGFCCLNHQVFVKWWNQPSVRHRRRLALVGSWGSSIQSSKKATFRRKNTPRMRRMEIAKNDPNTDWYRDRYRYRYLGMDRIDMRTK
jgi:hypothetical protein